jgi:fatty acid desaturase
VAEQLPIKARLNPLSIEQARVQLSAGIEDRLSELQHLNGWRRSFDFVFFPFLWLCGAILTQISYTMLASKMGLLLRLIGLFLSAIGLHAFGLLIHEGIHYTLFTRKFWNRWISVALGGAVLISFTAYQVLHLRHHQYLGDPRDPDDYHNYTNRLTLVWMLHYMRLTIGAFLYIILIPFVAYGHASKIERKRILVEYSLLGLAYIWVLTAFPFETILHVWLIPLIPVGYMTNIRGFTQHGITDAKDPFLASRSIHTNPVIAFCVLHENYHLEHHLFPEVPSYQLERLHKLIWNRLPRVVSSSYLGFLVQFFRATPTLDETPIGLIKK